MDSGTRKAHVVGVVLAGGMGTRMGHLDKPLLPLCGKPLIAHVIMSAAAQTSELVISVNRNLAAYSELRLPLIKDADGLPGGPLAGILAAMEWYVSQESGADYLACFPADVPCFPADIVARLLEAMTGLTDTEADAARPVIWCRTGSQPQPLFSLWPCSGLRKLEAALEAHTPGPRLYFQSNPNFCVQLPEPDGLNFFNINSPADLEYAESYYRESGSA